MPRQGEEAQRRGAPRIDEDGDGRDFCSHSQLTVKEGKVTISDSSATAANVDKVLLPAGL